MSFSLFMVKAWRWMKGKIRPVSALFAILMLFAYLYPPHLHRLLQPQISLVWRALLVVFYHKSGLHLFVNIIWTLNIGAYFEKRHGSWYFLGTTTLMIFLSQGLTLLIYPLYAFFTIQFLHVSMLRPKLNSFTLGFSGVLFALHFLMATSSPSHSIEHGLLLRSHSHGLLLEGLFLLASFQTLILPDSHFINNLCGILAGFVHINIPLRSMALVTCGMIMYVEVIYPMYHTLSNIFQKVSVKAHRYYYHLFPQDSLAMEHPHANDHDNDGYEGEDTDNHHGEDREEEDDEEAMDPTLQWECRRCLRRNGVYFISCQFCRELRTPEYIGSSSIHLLRQGMPHHLHFVNLYAYK